MRFTSTLTAILLGAASLVSVANASLANAAAIPLAKADDSVSLLDTRDGGTFVPMGGNNAQPAGASGFYTTGLITCIGVVITGTPSAMWRNGIFMAHLTGNWVTMQNEWTKLYNLVEQAGIQDKKAYISYPDTTTGPQSAEDKAETDNTVQQLTARVSALINGSPTYVKHSQDLPGGTMSVTGAGVVTIDGTVY